MSALNALNWSPVEGPGLALKLIVSAADFLALSGAVRPAGYYRGSDACGNAVIVRVVA